ncbi:hypothetical protein [Varunaivibrio sulfuroxidans]|uniref:Uncharacterized protein n=1 Tax=Varunaivibrio sulfuroxidans TaxID=1773489 RepID=A0A4R3J891_9PROT|nr:hypothetical protein [Varunaivibrio sulfuroxidans]TCS61664.1 hypothetical protein EDD55_10773 [Varunaivibrio sulfuroxidans]WES32150.1 hypothetical protein P3M64_07265 [Varunaivibrio sulfuroxidans]
MLGLGELIGTIAVFIAMVALWLASDTLKKVDNQNQKFVELYIKKLRAEVAEARNETDKMSRAIKTLEDKAGALHVKHENDSARLKKLSDNVQTLQDAFSQLDESIPQRLRVARGASRRTVQ